MFKRISTGTGLYKVKIHFFNILEELATLNSLKSNVTETELFVRVSKTSGQFDLKICYN